MGKFALPPFKVHTVTQSLTQAVRKNPGGKREKRERGTEKREEIEREEKERERER